MPTAHLNTRLSRKRISRLRLLYKLTDRELEACSLLAMRRTNREIAEAMGVSEPTARHHTESVLRKLGVRSRIDVARFMSVQTKGHA